MLIIEIKKGEGIDIALKRLKFKFKKTKITEQLRERMEYKKPSEKKRATKLKAIYKQQKAREADE